MEDMWFDRSLLRDINLEPSMSDLVAWLAMEDEFFSWAMRDLLEDSIGSVDV